MGERHGRLAGGLAAAWESALNSARNLTGLAERVPPAQRARLLVLAAFCRSHASRLLARLTAMGRGPLPVPRLVPDSEGRPLREALQHEALAAKTNALRFRRLSALGRKQGDVSSAWVCELNRGEEEERAAELLGLAAGAPLQENPTMEPAGVLP